jgi:hypothetical protein
MFVKPLLFEFALSEALLTRISLQVLSQDEQDPLVSLFRRAQESSADFLLIVSLFLLHFVSFDLITMSNN